MLTGKLPFQAADALEWVHCHVARAPAPLAQVQSTVPAAHLRPGDEAAGQGGRGSLPERARSAPRPGTLSGRLARAGRDLARSRWGSRTCPSAGRFPTGSTGASGSCGAAGRVHRVVRDGGALRAGAGLRLLGDRQILAGQRAAGAHRPVARPLCRRESSPSTTGRAPIALSLRRSAASCSRSWPRATIGSSGGAPACRPPWAARASSSSTSCLCWDS